MTTILFVGANNPPTGNDLTITGRLTALGYTLVYAADEEAEYAGAYDGMVISDSCAGATLATKYAAVAKPCVALETQFWSASGMVLNVTNSTGVTAWDVTEAGALDAGLVGTQTIYSSGQTQTFSASGSVGSGAQIVGSVTGTTNRCYFAFETGATQNTGTAPARRVGIRFTDAAVPAVTAAGWSLFDEAVKWAVPLAAALPSGTAVGTFTFTGTAVGDAPSGTGTGTATGTWTFTGAATGDARTVSPWSDPVTETTPGAGDAAGTWTYTGAATGAAPATAPAEGAATGTWAYAGAATGKHTPKGSTTGSWAFTGASAGKRTQKGSATGTWATTGAATGTAPTVGVNDGAAAGTWGFTGAAAGKRTPKGTAVGTWTHVGVAQGSAPAEDQQAGSAAGFWTITGTATGRKQPVGTAAGTFGYAGTATGVTQRRGTAAGTWAFTGTALQSLPGTRVPGTATLTYREGFATLVAAGTAQTTALGTSPLGRSPLGSAPHPYAVAGTATLTAKPAGTAALTYTEGSSTLATVGVQQTTALGTSPLGTSPLGSALHPYVNAGTALLDNTEGSADLTPALPATVTMLITERV